MEFVVKVELIVLLKGGLNGQAEDKTRTQATERERERERERDGVTKHEPKKVNGGRYKRKFILKQQNHAFKSKRNMHFQDKID
jgi:hypothetical protein